MQSERSGGNESSKHPVEDDNEAPETPLDEPRPPRIQDPPPQPDPKHPYVVMHMNNVPAAAGEQRVVERRSASERQP